MADRPKLFEPGRKPATWPIKVLAPLLMARMPRADWPVADSESGMEFWRTLGKNLIARGVTQEEADLASQAMAGDPPDYLSDVPKRLMAEVELVWQRKRADELGRSGDPIQDRKGAESASRNCPDCGGNGFATRYSWEPSTNSEDKPRPADHGYSFFCTCAMGRFLCRNADQDTHRKVGDLAEHADLQVGRVDWSETPDHFRRYRKADWDLDSGRPKWCAYHSEGTPLSAITAFITGATKSAADDVFRPRTIRGRSRPA
jgi:hypothetical protein